MFRRSAKNGGGFMMEAPLPIAKILPKPREDWFRIAKKGGRTASSDIDWRKYNPNDFLFSHCSILSSSATEADGHTIKKSSEHLINANGNAWTSPVLLATFRSFIGKPNYKEHVAVPSLSYGTILDAVIRPFRYKLGDDISDVFICDILVATEKKHTLLCRDIESGRMKTLSMGTTCRVIQCSHCGKKFNDEDDVCDHLKYNILGKYIDSNGIERITSELCGCSFKDPVTGEWVGDPESQSYAEASWVGTPAYKGAVVNHFIKPEDVGDKIDNMFMKNLEGAVANRAANSWQRVAMKIARQAEELERRERMVDMIIGVK